ncbi:MAG TPA: Do family serine endopeptidase [Deltaproteobacteria bacterium]|nr:Do family serine endopeptidase [Deltaproteobacteria bacterium]
MRVRRALFVLWLLAFLPVLVWASGLEELQGALRRAAQRAIPAVVNVSTLRVYRTPGGIPSPFWQDPFFRQFFGEDFFRFFGIPRERVERSLGSGVIVSPEGYILTNYHVIAKASQVVVGLVDKREFEAQVVGVDPHTDLALLKIEAEDLPSLPFGDSDRAQVGDVVLAIGNPFGIGQTVTMGIISAKGRSNMGLVDYEDFIQTDAAINPGNSGGALVNLRGELIGINTAIVSRTGGYQGIGFAIPSNIARWVMGELIRHGRVIRGWFGVTVQELTPELAKHFGLEEPRGALVVEVYPGSPAERAGLRKGDVILKYNGRTIREAWELRNLVATTPVGRKVPLVVWRKGRKKELQVKIVEPPPS